MPWPIYERKKQMTAEVTAVYPAKISIEHLAVVATTISLMNQMLNIPGMTPSILAETHQDLQKIRDRVQTLL